MGPHQQGPHPVLALQVGQTALDLLGKPAVADRVDPPRSRCLHHHQGPDGLGVGPSLFHWVTSGRKEVERISGQRSVPVLVTDDGEVIAAAHNRREIDRDLWLAPATVEQRQEAVKAKKATTFSPRSKGMASTAWPRLAMPSARGLFHLAALYWHGGTTDCAG